MKKHLFYLTIISVFFTISIMSVAFVLEKINRNNFISKFEKIPLGTSSTKLCTVFGEPRIFYGAEVSIIFPNITRNSNSSFKVYRFSKSSFFIPIVSYFLIKNDIVYDKKLIQ